MPELTPDVMQPWADFFVAEVGAAAALTGLLFVAVSINLTRVLQFPTLPALALETLVAFATVLVVASFGLVPGQPPAVFGAEVGAVGLLAGGWRLVGAVRQFEEARKYGGFVTRTALSLGAPLCFVAAGALLARAHPAATYWLVAGVLVSFVAGLVGAWVLLIEILR